MQVVYVIICFPVHKYKSRLSVLGNLDFLVRLYGNEFWASYETFECVTYKYRSGTVNSNTVNSKFHLIRSFCEIFARFLSFHV